MYGILIDNLHFLPTAQPQSISNVKRQICLEGPTTLARKLQRLNLRFRTGNSVTLA